MNPVFMPTKSSLFTSVLVSTALMIVSGCGGSKESSQPGPAPRDAQSGGNAIKEVTSQEPTMANMKTAVVDAIQTISTNTVKEITHLAKADEAIQVPDSLEKVESALQAAGQSDLIKGFTSSLNETAVGALSGYKDSISKTIGALNIADVEQVIKGGDDSMTRYLENTANNQLKQNLIPYVKGALKDTQAEDWLEKIKEALPEDTGGLLGKVSAATGVSIPTDFDVESYLTDELLGKFFSVMANQEKLFRQDPQGRSADLFKKIMAAAQ